MSFRKKISVRPVLPKGRSGSSLNGDSRQWIISEESKTFNPTYLEHSKLKKVQHEVERLAKTDNSDIKLPSITTIQSSQPDDYSLLHNEKFTYANSIPSKKLSKRVKLQPKLISKSLKDVIRESGNGNPLEYRGNVSSIHTNDQGASVSENSSVALLSLMEENPVTLYTPVIVAMSNYVDKMNAKQNNQRRSENEMLKACITKSKGVRVQTEIGGSSIVGRYDTKIGMESRCDGNEKCCTVTSVKSKSHSKTEILNPCIVEDFLDCNHKKNLDTQLKEKQASSDIDVINPSELMEGKTETIENVAWIQTHCKFSNTNLEEDLRAQSKSSSTDNKKLKQLNFDVSVRSETAGSDTMHKRVWFQHHNNQLEENKKMVNVDITKDTSLGGAAVKHNYQSFHGNVSGAATVEKNKSDLGDIVTLSKKDKVDIMSTDYSSQSEGEHNSNNSLRKKKFRPNLQVERLLHLSSFSPYSSCSGEPGTSSKKRNFVQSTKEKSKEKKKDDSPGKNTATNHHMKRKQKNPRKKRPKVRPEKQKLRKEARKKKRKNKESKLQEGKEIDENVEPNVKKTKYSSERDLATLTMQELINYKPKSFKKAELRATSFKKAELRATSHPVTNPVDMEKIASKGAEDDKNKALKTEEAPEVEDERQGKDLAITAPQLMVNADGEIIIDESSLMLRKKIDDSALQKNKVLYENSLSIGTARRFKTRGRRWNIEDTLKFYKALSQIGTDFTLMAKVFNNHTRNELKKKFKLEERINADLIDRALDNRLPLNMEMFFKSKVELRDILDGESITSKENSTISTDISLLIQKENTVLEDCANAT